MCLYSSSQNAPPVAKSQTQLTSFQPCSDQHFPAPPYNGTTSTQTEARARQPLLCPSIKIKSTDKVLPDCFSSFPCLAYSYRKQTKEMSHGEQPRVPSCLLQPKPLSANRKVGPSALLRQDPLALTRALPCFQRVATVAPQGAGKGTHWK